MGPVIEDRGLMTEDSEIMSIGSLFAGVGGFDFAAQIAGMKIAWQIEKDQYCLKVLEKNFPGVKKYGDVKNVKGEELEKVDIITAGIPCQPFSVAGKQRGRKDDRYLWPEVLRILSSVQPEWLVVENTPGLIRMELDNMLSDLESQGYTAETYLLPACGVGAPHRRNRVWIVAYSHRSGFKRNNRWKQDDLAENLYPDVPHAYNRGCKGSAAKRTKKSQADVVEVEKSYSDTDGKRCEKFNTPEITAKKEIQKYSKIPIREWLSGWWAVEPPVGRVANGVPDRVDRIKGLGNAVVPQLAFRILMAIQEIECWTNKTDGTCD